MGRLGRVLSYAVGKEPRDGISREQKKTGLGSFISWLVIASGARWNWGDRVGRAVGNTSPSCECCVCVVWDGVQPVASPAKQFPLPASWNIVA